MDQLFDPQTYVTNVTTIDFYSDDLCAKEIKAPMEILRNTILRGWNVMRGLRLAMGLIVAYQAFELGNGLLGLLAGLFIFQALANVGCCGAGSCNTAPRKKTFGKTEDVEFEEIKGK